MLSIQLHAQNIEKKLNRFYGLRVTKNLFGAWSITIQYTQLGKRGPSKMFFCDTIEEAKLRVNLILKRRLSYNTRLGFQYKITHINTDPNFKLEEWIPNYSELPQDLISSTI